MGNSPSRRARYLVCRSIALWRHHSIWSVAHVWSKADRPRGNRGNRRAGAPCRKICQCLGLRGTAFTSSMSKTEELRGFGAHRIVSSRNSPEILSAAHSLDFLLVTVNTSLDWSALLKTLKPNGRMHVVGAVLEPMPISAFDLIMKQKSVSGSPTGGPAAISAMLDFAARHNVSPQVEHFPLAKG